MLTRRMFLASTAAVAALLAAGPAARAQEADATEFVRRFGNQALAIVGGPGSAAEKRQRLEPLITQAVDIEDIGRFVLGRFWRTATPQQQQEFQRLFNQVLLNNVGGRIGEFSGVGFTMTGTTQRDSGIHVGTTISRPNQQPVAVEWVVSNASGRPRIIDVIAEGTSLRLTQRNDYASFISRNGGQVDALLGAMRRQAG